MTYNLSIVTICLNFVMAYIYFGSDIFSKGEEQKKLDVLSNEVFIKALVSSGRTVLTLRTMFSFSNFMIVSFCAYICCEITDSAFSSRKKMKRQHSWNLLYVESTPHKMNPIYPFLSSHFSTFLTDL